MADIPSSSNLYGSFRGRVSKAQIAAFFEADGWSVRKCSWTDFEVTSQFAELVIEGNDPILLHGPVADISCNVDRIAGVLAKSGQPYSLECYDDGNTLLKVVEWQGS